MPAHSSLVKFTEADGILMTFEMAARNIHSQLQQALILCTSSSQPQRVLQLQMKQFGEQVQNAWNMALEGIDISHTAGHRISDSQRNEYADVVKIFEKACERIGIALRRAYGVCLNSGNPRRSLEECKERFGVLVAMAWQMHEDN